MGANSPIGWTNVAGDRILGTPGLSDATRQASIASEPAQRQGAAALGAGK